MRSKRLLRRCLSDGKRRGAAPPPGLPKCRKGSPVVSGFEVRACTPKLLGGSLNSADASRV
eukprot:scaffold227099_cov30-Prasinocladus_malaysianus.AAC.2